MVTFKPLDYRRLVSNVSVYQNALDRLRTVVQGPDGYVYVYTSNRDGRGIPFEGDDKIVKSLETPEATE